MDIQEAKDIINKEREERVNDIAKQVYQLELERKKVNQEYDQKIQNILGDEFVVVESREIIAKKL